MRRIARLPVAYARRAAHQAAGLLARDPRIQLIYTFGSSVHGSVPVRDVDLAVLAVPPLTLDELVRARADLGAATGGAPIDLVSLNEASIVLAHEVVETGTCLFARTPDVETDFVTRARARYWDFKPYRDEQWRLAGERAAERRHGAYCRLDALRERLLHLEEVVSRLEELRRDDLAGSPAGFRDTWAVERGLQLAAETAFDIGNHILSAHFGVSAQDYEDILTKLGEVGVIESGLRERLRGLGGFRNILVHGYLEIDPERIREAPRRGPTDFSGFGIAIRRWLEQLTR